jgi:tocopherol O-methyltransferase
MESNLNAQYGQRLNEEEIVQYYDQCQIDYEIVWHLKSQMSMHYGYFYPETKTLREALINLNWELAKFGDMPKNALVLDAGCGVGGSSIFLAKNFRNKTKGITLSEKQVLKAKENSKNHGVDNLCQFEVQNYLETNFKDNTFDVVWGVESVCYAPDKIDFLKEAFRILKPGGKLFIADFFENDIDNEAKDELLMQKWVETWAISSYAGMQEFSNKINKVGFENARRKDVTVNVFKSIRRLYQASFLGLPITYVSQFFGFRTKTQTSNTWSSYYQYKAYKKNLWKYCFFTATKPF